uniref:Uncharacterized protein n=1 Tax=Solanum lycopersicum TaxID=4081 RepID=A0A3Q7EAL6_SOLLC
MYAASQTHAVIFGEKWHPTVPFVRLLLLFLKTRMVLAPNGAIKNHCSQAHRRLEFAAPRKVHGSKYADKNVEYRDEAANKSLPSMAAGFARKKKENVSVVSFSPRSRPQRYFGSCSAIGNTNRFSTVNNYQPPPQAPLPIYYAQQNY